MNVEQLAVFLENKSGRLAEVTHILAEHNINIKALSVADTIDFGILRLIVDNVGKANDILKENGFTVGKIDVVAVEVGDQPGGLASVLTVIDKAGLNVEYMYAFINSSGNNAILIFRFDEMEKANETLTKAGIKILNSEKLRAL